MPEHQADSRTLNFAGDVDDQGRPLPMTVEVLRARTEKWPRSPHAPDEVALQLARARQMFIDGYYTYENFVDAATRSLQAVEAGLRVRLEAGSKTRFAQLIDQAQGTGLIDDSAHDILHTGRILRNQQIHATMTASTTLRSPPASSGPHTSWWLNCSRTGEGTRWTRLKVALILTRVSMQFLACPQAARTRLTWLRVGSLRK